MQYTFLQILASFGPRRFDLWRLGPQNLAKTTSGEVEYYIQFVTQKTGMIIEVPLTSAVGESY